MSVQPAGPLEPGDPGFAPNPTAAAIDMAAVPGQPDTFEFIDYFGFTAIEHYTLPDGRSVIDFAVMNEGKRAQFQRATNSGVEINRTSGNAKINMDPGNERHELIRASVVNWNLQRRDSRSGQTFNVPFDDRALTEFLSKADPRIVDGLEKAIREANPWLITDSMTVEEIDNEMDRLRELRTKVDLANRGE